MYFNLFLYDVSPNLDAVTLMVQLSGIVATVVTLLAGALSDKLGMRRRFISVGYIIWGVTVALFGFISPTLVGSIFNTSATETVSVTLALIIAADCIMTLFGSTANDAAFNAWVTDNTDSSNRGRVEGVVAVMPLVAMLAVVGGFGILVESFGYSAVFLTLGGFISLCGVFGIFIIRDSKDLSPSGKLRDLLWGFRPSVVKANPALYVALLTVMVYGVACQIFMPYMVIYMREYLGFNSIEYSLVFGGAILVGAAINLFLGRLSDRRDKTQLLYAASAVMAVGLLLMYFAKGLEKPLTLALFGLSGFVMITGYIFVSALCGAVVRDRTPDGAVGRLQGVRMVFSVLIPMLAGPAIGNAINRAMNIRLENAGADAMTTEFVPAPEIYLVAAAVTALVPILVWLLRRVSVNKGATGNEG